MARGGKREGSGRKPVKVKSPQANIRLSGELAVWWGQADEATRAKVRSAIYGVMRPGKP